MISNELKKLLKGIYPALLLEDIFPHAIRRICLKLVTIGLAIFALLVVFGPDVDAHIKGGFTLSLFILLFIVSLEGYFYSIFSKSNDGEWLIPFEIGKIIFYAEDDDLTKGFVFSDIGDEVLKRLGFEENEIRDFIRSKPLVSLVKSKIMEGEHISLLRYGNILYDHDENLANFLFTKGISKAEFVGAISWIVNNQYEKINQERWWSKEHLGTIEGIGKNWAYGETYMLEKYGEDITEQISTHTSGLEATHRLPTDRIEAILLRGDGANIVVTSADNASRLDVIYVFARKIHDGKTAGALRDKRIFVINSNILVENTGKKIDFEREFSNVLLEASRARNVILVIPDFTMFIKSSESLGADVVSIMGPYLKSPHLHIIALDSSDNYHGTLSNHSVIKENFEAVPADQSNDDGVLAFITHSVLNIEKSSHAFFTYPSLVSAISCAKQYFDRNVYADKALEIITDTAISVLSQGRSKIFKDDVLAIIESKTGVPIRVPQGKEREDLIHLEDLLHKRIVGQDDAIKVISSALKRARAGIKNATKPIGTFLFLGPTGVGKTETAKALADVFFGSENSISRFDMSEYRGGDALSKLIGSFGGNEVGNLVMKVKEKPYGVMLLDEFEKTTPEVMNVFLRIFDEGVFSDASGTPLNVKNNIIIATSNAGSDLIWQYNKEGKDLNQNKDEIIEALIKKGIFTPELLNRFDNVVIFHPLHDDHMKNIAKIAVSNFAEGLKEKGIRLNVTDDALQALIKSGVNKEFGARSLNRVIQETLERLLAEKIIEGEVKEGSMVSFELDSHNALKIELV